MRWIVIGLVVFGTGCTSILDRLATDHYSKNYITDIEVVDRDPKGLPAPEVQNTLLSGHEERVRNHKNGGWQVLGVTEFNTYGSTRVNHLYNLARRKGASLVVHSKKFDRREQEIIKRREYQPGKRISVNGNTVQLEGRWVDVVDFETRVYHDYRATFLRPGSE